MSNYVKRILLFFVESGDKIIVLELIKYGDFFLQNMKFIMYTMDESAG